MVRRWEDRKGKQKGIKFAEDPEWHPDARVVLFQELPSGNRAWVICDYDRHLIAYWRPKGSSTKETMMVVMLVVYRGERDLRGPLHPGEEGGGLPPLLPLRPPRVLRRRVRPGPSIPSRTALSPFICYCLSLA